MMPFQRFSIAALSASIVSIACWTTPAQADRSIIKYPNQHPKYGLELEPHGLVGAFNSPVNGADTGFGVGARFTIPIVENGFVKTINNSVGIGFGADLTHYSWNYCDRDPAIPCWDYSTNVVWLPVVMQWNFFLSENWSVFGEPGLGLHYVSWGGDTYDRYCDRGRCDDDFELDPFIFYAGGRYHFDDTTTLTIRLGYPTISVGVSFLL